MIEPRSFEIASRLSLQGFEMLRESACGWGSLDLAAQSERAVSP